MFSKISSAAVDGISALIVQVEVDVSEGLPVFSMVGFLSSEVREAKDRVKTALKNSNYLLPPKHITVNLSPADIRKAGTAFDLPIAVAMMAAFEFIPQERTEETIIVGELSLNGRINRVNGILPIVCAAKENGYKRCIVPKENLPEGAVVEGISVYGVENISEVIEYMLGISELMTMNIDNSELLRRRSNTDKQDFSDISGQWAARRAIEIAVSGQHNILLSGQPGAGKTMMAKRIPSIMPSLTFEESLEMSKIYSVAGKLDTENVLITERPFRAPHHTITVNALTGGGRIPVPGEISLATGGVLFLDELPEFNRNVIEALRQPLEEKKVTISRVNASYTYPAGFMLAASQNPCPCGFYPDRNRCKCTLNMIKRYRSRISDPILDRIDIYVDVAPARYEELEKNDNNESSESIRSRVMRVRDIQLDRYKNEKIFFNSQLTPGQLSKYCITDSSARDMAEDAFRRLKLSPRAYHRILKVSRTIADMEGSEIIRAAHVAESLCYRMSDMKSIT